MLSARQPAPGAAMHTKWRIGAVLLACLTACGTTAAPATDAATSDADAGTTDAHDGPPFAMAINARKSFYDGPFPSDDLFGTVSAGTDGPAELTLKLDVPNPDSVVTVDQCRTLLQRDANGFSQTGAIYFRAGAPLDPASLPSSLTASLRDDASVYLVSLDDPPAMRRKHPVEVAFLADGGPFGDKNLLAILPLQGVPLKPGVRYVAVVTRAVAYADGTHPTQAPEIQLLKASALNLDPTAVQPWTRYVDALVAEPDFLAGPNVAAFALFTTDNRAGDMTQAHEDAQKNHPVVGPPSAPTLTDTFGNFCVFQSTVQVPVYQHGTPPYSSDGGDWRWSAGTIGSHFGPVFDHMETARIWFSVPRKPLPTAGFPTVFFIGTGAGGDRGMVDRGACAEVGCGGADVPGSGPAMEFARVGWAGIQIDGTLEGIRNTTGGNEDFLLFNVFNIAALRDNIRQSALEIALLPDALQAYTFDTSACPGAPPQFRMDNGHFALMGHSMGASIAPLALYAQPLFQTAILSGAGGSFINNIMDKQLPMPVRPIAEGLLGYDVRGRTLTKFDPALTLFQWATEPADSPPYGPALVRNAAKPRNILMFQGIVDHYILPSIAQATSLSMGLDLVGPDLAAVNPEENSLLQPHLTDLLPLVGRAQLPFPASGNAPGVTAVVVQNPGDAYKDGHEVNFQTPKPKSQYRCFLTDVAADTLPTLRTDGATDACWPAQ